MSYVDPDRTITNAMGATFSSPEFGGSPPLTPYTKIDGFGEGCLGGAGRIPKTFTSPIEFFSPPKGAMAKEGPVAPWFGAFGCGDAGSKCWAGDIPGGTFLAWAYNDLTFNNFGAPLLVLLYIDFIGTMAFLYSAADLCGLMNEKGDNFPGCYGAFMADGIGTMLGGLLGTSSLTTYGESMTGVYEGGRTGLTALTIAFFNFLSIFLIFLLAFLLETFLGHLSLREISFAMFFSKSALSVLSSARSSSFPSSLALSSFVFFESLDLANRF